MTDLISGILQLMIPPAFCVGLIWLYLEFPKNTYGGSNE